MLSGPGLCLYTVLRTLNRPAPRGRSFHFRKVSMPAQSPSVPPLTPAPRDGPAAGAGVARLTHLARLEAESIHIMREVAAEFSKPLLMYSIGKDSSVLLHLARKAFFPGRIPFPLLHIDTGWKFREMIAFRDKMVADYDLD